MGISRDTGRREESGASRLPSAVGEATAGVGVTLKTQRFSIVSVVVNHFVYSSAQLASRQIAYNPPRGDPKYARRVRARAPTSVSTRSWCRAR